MAIQMQWHSEILFKFFYFQRTNQVVLGYLYSNFNWATNTIFPSTTP